MLDLEEIFAKGENDHVEFKRSLAEEKEIIETIGAFLNHRGGLIIVGYDEKKRDVVDVNTGTETIQRFVNKVKLVTHPQVLVDTYEMEYKRKNLLIISVIDYPIKPVSVYGKFYRRRLNSNHLMTPIEISNLHLISLNSSWDFQVAQDSSLKDIDMDIVDWFIKTLNEVKENKVTESPLKFLEKCEIIRENKPTFAALLLFPKNPSFVLDVQIGLFEDDITIKKDKNIKKSVLFEVDDVMEFITAYITKEFIITGKPRREERWQYPLDAIREIVINAVIHRDYQEGTHTQIKVYRDKIKFWNSGKLPPDLSIETIKAGLSKSRPRNRLIAQTFKELGLIEKYGAGVKRVIDDFKAYGLDEPDFMEIAGGFEVIVLDKVKEDQSGKKETTKITQPIIQPTTQITTQMTTQNTTQKILELIGYNPKITRKEMARGIGISEDGIKYNLNKLKEKGIIIRKGTLRSGYWEIRKIKEGNIKSSGRLGKKLSEGLGEGLGERLGEMQSRIISLMVEDNKISIPLLSEKIGISTTAVEKHIDRLKKEGIVNRKGSPRGGYWEIKLRR
ncbi:MAG: winged helix-turn-helix transcriptional regulator [Candidatus Aminicenantes bacterium]|nr:MAG: winged helix-turn-helix transcriptional regulator [Candidatus Aminicenantes bacterium]